MDSRGLLQYTAGGLFAFRLNSASSMNIGALVDYLDQLVGPGADAPVIEKLADEILTEIARGLEQGVPQDHRSAILLRLSLDACRSDHFPTIASRVYERIRLAAGRLPTALRRVMPNRKDQSDAFVLHTTSITDLVSSASPRQLVSLACTLDDAAIAVGASEIHCFDIQVDGSVTDQSNAAVRALPYVLQMTDRVVAYLSCDLDDNASRDQSIQLAAKLLAETPYAESSAGPGRLTIRDRRRNCSCGCVEQRILDDATKPICVGVLRSVSADGFPAAPGGSSGRLAKQLATELERLTTLSYLPVVRNVVTTTASVPARQSRESYVADLKAIAATVPAAERGSEINIRRIANAIRRRN